MMRLPKDVGALPGPIGEKHFPGELEADFDAVLASVSASPVGIEQGAVEIAFWLAEPILGAMPVRVKAQLEEAVGSGQGNQRIRSTALNLILNLILYPAILTAFAVAVLGDRLFSQSTGGWIMLGVLIASAEAAWRLREGVIHAKPAGELTYRGCWYGLGLARIGSMLARAMGVVRKQSTRRHSTGSRAPCMKTKPSAIAATGPFTRRRVCQRVPGSARMPRKLPPSSLKGLWNLPDEMPDYDYNIVLGDNVLAINASVRGKTIRRLSYVSSASRPISRPESVGKPVGAFKHRMRDKLLEVVVLKAEAAQTQHAA